MPRCYRCQREIAETLHKGDTYRIDGYWLHTGKTKNVQTQADDGHAHHHLQLFDAQNVHLCVDCFARPEIHDVWLRFPGSDELQKLCR